MRRWALILLAAGCAAPGPQTGEPQPVYVDDVDAADPSAELYDPRNLPRFDLELDAAALESLRESPRDKVRARLRYRGETLDVGVRLKGEYSFRPVDEKPSFRITVDEFVPEQRLRGVDELVLNNTIQDPSFLGERLAYALFRSAGLPASRANSALVFVNGAFYGVYTNVEAQDKTFLKRWFGSNKGNMYEENGVDFLPGAEALFDLETNEAVGDRSHLATFIAALTAATPADYPEVIAPHLDLSRFLRFCALELLSGHEDGYAFGPGKRNNFRIYDDPASGTFAFIPSGMDRALRPSRAPALVHEWVPPHPAYDSPWNAFGLVLVKCLANVPCRAAYVEAIDQMAAHFDAAGLPRLIDELAAQIRPAVQADERKELDNEYFEYALATMRTYVAGRTAAARAALHAGR